MLYLLFSRNLSTLQSTSYQISALPSEHSPSMLLIMLSLTHLYLMMLVRVLQSKETVVLLIVRAELQAEIYDKVAEHGVFVLSKPTSKAFMATALCWLSSAREKLRKTEKKTLSIEEKMAEIRIVNRAKWLLISELKMDEQGAHHYIEKQAMDRCISKRIVSEEIIKTYS